MIILKNFLIGIHNKIIYTNQFLAKMEIYGLYLVIIINYLFMILVKIFYKNKKKFNFIWNKNNINLENNKIIIKIMRIFKKIKSNK
jgi:hypothetical protein